jgi:hypothetical protein
MNTGPPLREHSIERNRKKRGMFMKLVDHGERRVDGTFPYRLRATTSTPCGGRHALVDVQTTAITAASSVNSWGLTKVRRAWLVDAKVTAAAVHPCRSGHILSRRASVKGR